MRPVKREPRPAVELRIESYMSPGAYTIRADQAIGEAHRVMRQHQIRHLPVFDGERLAGIVSQRDLVLLESLGGVDPGTTPVEDAMSTDVYVVQPAAVLARVANDMAE